MPDRTRPKATHTTTIYAARMIADGEALNGYQIKLKEQLTQAIRTASKPLRHQKKRVSSRWLLTQSKRSRCRSQQGLDDEVPSVDEIIDVDTMHAVQERDLNKPGMPAHIDRNHRTVCRLIELHIVPKVNRVIAAAQT